MLFETLGPHFATNTFFYSLYSRNRAGARGKAERIQAGRDRERQAAASRVILLLNISAARRFLREVDSLPYGGDGARDPLRRGPLPSPVCGLVPPSPGGKAALRRGRAPSSAPVLRHWGTFPRQGEGSAAAGSGDREGRPCGMIWRSCITRTDSISPVGFRGRLIASPTVRTGIAAAGTSSAAAPLWPVCDMQGSPARPHGDVPVSPGMDAGIRLLPPGRAVVTAVTRTDTYTRHM